MVRILAVRHMYSASLFTLEDIFREKGFEITYVEGFATNIAEIDPLTFDAVVVLGGSMGVYESHLFPFLNDEIALIQKCLRADHPLLGVCLGAQLMAAACDERVYKGTNGSEVGFMDIDVTEDGKTSPFRHFDKSVTKILQFHGDTFDLPEDAVLLASSAQYKNQAYRIGKNAFAVQFHPEYNATGFENTMVEGCSKFDVAHLRHDAKKYLIPMITAMRRTMDDMLGVWKI